MCGVAFHNIFVSDTIFGSTYHARTFMPKQNRLGINMDQSGVDQNNKPGK